MGGNIRGNSSLRKVAPMSLTEVGIKAIRPAEKISRHFDSGGLYLEVSPAGGRWWRFKYRIGGKEKRISLGVYPAVSLKSARLARDEARLLIAQGIDPGEKRKAERAAESGADTFEVVAREWHAKWRIGKDPRYASYVINRLEGDVFPDLGRKPIDTITARDVVDLLKKIEERGVIDLAHKALGKISQIYRYAIPLEKASRNPAADIKPGDVLTPKKKRNLARIDARELPALLVAVDEYDGKPLTRLALKLMTLTFVRTSELIGAAWAEFDGSWWRIPEERMKEDSPHIVPLSTQAKRVVEEIRKISGEGALVFPGERRGSMSNNTILFALYRMGYKSRMTGHGFRGLASTVLHEQGWPHEHIELQLAHHERDEVSAAYNHALYLGPRAKMMQAWADYLDVQLLKGRKKTPA